jgi:hypothetical protein
VLVDGEVVGTWRARAVRSHLQLSVEPFKRVTRGAIDEIEEEAACLAPFRGCDSSEVAVAEQT